MRVVPKFTARVAVALLAALLGAGLVAAQGGQGQQAPTGSDVFTVPAGGTATVRFEGFCYQFGESFPSAVGAPSGLADPGIRGALNLARAQGLIGSDQDALQVQYAIWQLQGEADAPEGGDLTRDIINRSRTAQVPAPSGATSLLDAAGAGQVTVEVVDFAPVGAPVEIAPGLSDNFYGRGALRITNTSGQDLQLYMPVGTIIPAQNPEEQDLVAYATGVEGDPAQAAQAAQATTAPTSAPTTAPTTAPTSAPTSAPTVAAPTAQATNVQAAGPTPLPTIATVQAQPTALPNTSGVALPIPALILLALAIGAAALRRGMRR